MGEWMINNPWIVDVLLWVGVWLGGGLIMLIVSGETTHTTDDDTP